MRKTYELLGEADEKGSIDSFTVYSDPEDIAERFSLEDQQKYFGSLLKHQQVVFEGVPRLGGTDISGTQMRVFLEKGMRDEFKSFMPEGIDAQGVWDLLAGKGVLRNYITGQLLDEA